MRDDDDGQTELLVDVRDECEDRFRRLRVERARRLVAEQHLRLARERTRDADALFLTARQLGRVLVRLVRKADEREQRRDLFLDLRRALSREFQRECDVVVDGRGREQVEVLKNHADVLARFAKLCAAHRRHVLAVDGDFACCWALEHVDAADERRLARARKTDDAVDFAAADGEIDAFQRLDGTGRAIVGFLNMGKLYHVFRLESIVTIYV